MRRFTSLVAGFVLLIAGCNRGASYKPPSIGQVAPRFTISDNQRSLSLDQFRGHVVVLNFWASWCPPCIEETPSLIALGQKIQNQGIILLAVSEDENDKEYLRFVSDHNLTSTMVVIRDNQGNVAPRYGTYIFPETYVIDPAGIIRRKFIGAIDWSKPEILESLVRLQAETPVPTRAAK